MTTPLPQFATSSDLQATPDDVYLDAAAGTIRAYCRWHVWPVLTETIVLDGPGTRTLFLPTMRLNAVTAISELDVPITVFTRRWWSQAGWIRKPAGQWWTDEPGGISVTYTHGYDNMPPELRGLALAVARRAASNPSGLIQRSVGSRSESYAPGQGPSLLADEMSMLDPYRRRV